MDRSPIIRLMFVGLLILAIIVTVWFILLD
jgi:hypothetical protein